MRESFNVVGLGEVLWDRFHDGASFGGAPANMLCNLSGLAKHEVKTCMLTAVGKDQLGNDAIDVLERHYINTALLQSNSFPTGSVIVTLDESNQADYVFSEDCAWDHLLWDDSWLDIIQNTDAVCFGSLAQRSDVSSESIKKLLIALPKNTLKVLDINLRAPFYTSEIIFNSLKLANVLKLNEEELPIIAKLLNFSGDQNTLLKKIQQQFELTSIALTKGKKGATVIHYDELVEVPIIPTRVKDTVGAGDAFTAAFIWGLLRGEKLIDIALFATKVSSFVCSKRGATPDLSHSKLTCQLGGSNELFKS